MKCNLAFLFVFFTLTGNAQEPWRSKLFVHFLDANNQIITDTIKFGCDRFGNIGYQEGLDIFDTIVSPNKILGFDSLVQIQRETGCVNLRQNVKAFDVGLVEFNFYALGNVIAVSWDTIDFKYNDTTYELRGARLSSKNAYLKMIDGRQFIMYNEQRPIKKFPEDSILFINDGSNITECSFSMEAAHLKLEVALGYHDVGLSEFWGNTITCDVYPVPTKNTLNISFDKTSDYELQLMNHFGATVLTQQLSNASNSINVELIPDGIYYMTLSDPKQETRFSKRIVIHH